MIFRNNSRRASKPSRTRLFIGAAATFCLINLLTNPGAEANYSVSPAVELAVLAENWAQVATLLKEVNPQTPSPVLRLIKGHACLAQNKNNQALCLFLSVTSDADRQTWHKWTEDFANQNSAKPAAYYLQGDGLSRMDLGHEAQAVAAFSQAVQLNPNHALSFHARGATYASLGKLDQAREEFKKATGNPGACAEFYTSMGTYMLQRRTDPKKAVEWFEKALKISPDYVLALNGKGSAKIVMRDYDGARADLEKAKSLANGCLSELTAVIQSNLQVLADERSRYLERQLAQATGTKPGVNFEERTKMFDGMSPTERQKAIDVVGNAYDFNQKVRGGMGPDKVEVSLGAGIKDSILGPTPYVEGKVAASKDLAATSTFNMENQKAVLDYAKEKYSMTPQPIGNTEAFFKQQMPFSDYGKMSKPGGVSAKELAEEPVETAAWNVFTLYGLLYKVKTA